MQTAFTRTDTGPKPTVVETETLKVTMTFHPSETASLEYRILFQDDSREFILPGGDRIKELINDSIGEATGVSTNQGKMIVFMVKPDGDSVELSQKLLLISDIIKEMTFTTQKRVQAR